MKFKTKRDSETGKKFQAVYGKAQVALKATKELIEELRAETWRPRGFPAAYGGISSIVFPDNFKGLLPHMKKMKYGSNEYMPRLTTKAGKVLQEKIDQLPTVTSFELNQCINYKEDFNMIGFSQKNPDHFLFEAGDDWNIKLPEDCTEITVKEYNELSSKVKEV